MSEENKPIFPRSSESSEEEKTKLRQQAKLNLENEEQKFPANQTEQTIICSKCQMESSAQAKFCRFCGNNLKLPLIPPTASTNNPLDEQKYKPEYQVINRAAWVLVNQNLTEYSDETQKLNWYGIRNEYVIRCLPYYLEKLKEVYQDTWKDYWE